MNKFDGLKLTSFLLGVIMPLCVAVYLISLLLDTKPVVVAQTTEETIQLAESYVSMFSVDYDIYGKYTLGVDKVVGEVCNNSSNVLICRVWLEDMEGNVISDVVTLEPSDRNLVFLVTQSWETAGRYDVKLIYEVPVGEDTSRIECPYVVLVNGGL